MRHAARSVVTLRRGATRRAPKVDVRAVHLEGALARPRRDAVIEESIEGSSHENSGRHRRLASAGQRRGAHAGPRGARGAALGAEIEFLAPAEFRTLPMPSYPEIRLALPDRRRRAAASTASADAMHIATEGPLGHAMRRVCLRRGCPSPPAFTPAFPIISPAAAGAGALDCDVAWAWLRRFHRAGRGGAGGDADACG